MRDLTARDVMTPEVMAVSADLTLREVARFLIDREITGAPVVDGRGCLLGVVSLADIARAFGELENAGGTAPRRLTSRPPEALELLFAEDPVEESSVEEELADEELAEEPPLQVWDVMSNPVLSVGPDTPLEEVARTMLQARFHRVMVTSGEKLVGVVSSMDLVRTLADVILAR
jgi:CBS domain-containing protein